MTHPGDNHRQPGATAQTLLALTALPARDLPAYLQAASATLAQTLRLEAIGVLVLDERGEALITPAELAGPGDRSKRRARVALGGRSDLVAVFRAGVPYRVAAVSDESVPAGILGGTADGALLAVPFLSAGERRGLFYAVGRPKVDLTEADQAVLAVVAARIGVLVEQTDLEGHRTLLERERARQEVRQEFLSIVSHELKTPVAVIKAYAEVLQQRARQSGDGEGVRIVSRVEEQADRMLGLIDDLLDLQRLQTGLMHLEESRIDLADLAAIVAGELQATTTRHRIVVRAPRPVPVRADRRRMEQVLANLVQNAIKYSPEGGEIGVDVRLAAGPDGRGERALLTVSDHGIGIAAEDLQHIFSRFYQGEGGRLYRGVRGLGVGLYIAREIVERHGGTIWATSTQGEGSTFCLALPALPRVHHEPDQEASSQNRPP
jgi:signal transduction histidine kinase